MQPVSVSAAGTVEPKKRRHRKKSEWRKAFAPKNLADTLLTGYLPILIALLIIVLPLAWMVLSSFKPANEIVTMDPSLLPQDPTLDNYAAVGDRRSEEHTSELQSRGHLVCRLLLEKK